MYTVTYHIAPRNAEYTYQRDKGSNKAGVTTTSAAGHMWYTVNDGHGNKRSFGFESENGNSGLITNEPGRISDVDSEAYRGRVRSITIQITEEEHEKLINFGETPGKLFNSNRYNALTNSCVDFVYKSLEILGIDLKNGEGSVMPKSNIKVFEEWMKDGERLAYWETGTSCNITPKTNEEFRRARAHIERRDPLSLDLNGNGIETVPASAGITFDFNGDGLKTGTGWLAPSDGFLVLDRNDNGRIDNGGELFGVDTVKANGQKATDGFDALRDFDSNEDGLFNTDDERFADVRVWQDLNQDGISQPDELKTLAEHGITAIALQARQTDIASNDNVISALGHFLRDNGEIGTVNANQSLAANLDLASNPFYREYTDRLPLDPDVAALPGMKGSGAVRDLHEAAMQNPELRERLAAYAQAQTRSEQFVLLDGLLSAWAQSSSYRTFDTRIGDMRNARFAYSWTLPADSDAPASGPTRSTTSEGKVARSGPTEEQLKTQRLLERVKVLEVFNGQDFFTFPTPEPASGKNDSYAVNLRVGSRPLTARAEGTGTFYITEKHLAPNAEQAGFLDASYEALRKSVYDGLLLKTRLQPYMDRLELRLAEGGEAFELSLAGVYAALAERAQDSPLYALLDAFDLSRLLDKEAELQQHVKNLVPALLDRLNEAEMAEFAAHAAWARPDKAYLFGTPGDDQLKAGDRNSIVYGGAGNDELDGGTGSNELYGGDGDDVLRVSEYAKDNLFVGGKGNDTMYGSKYADTYVFNLGDGHDTIVERSSYHTRNEVDILRFGEGIAPADISVQRQGANVVFKHVNGTDQVSIRNWLENDKLGAHDSREHQVERIEFADGTKWTWEDVNKRGFTQHAADTGETLNGWYGRDILRGGAGNDVLDGGQGSNELYGGDGDDVLRVSEYAKDNLFVGGKGNDTMHGSYYADTYVFNLGDGHDTIVERSSYHTRNEVDILRFGEGIDPQSLSFRRQGADLLILIGTDGKDQVLIKNWLTSNQTDAYYARDHLIEHFEFADGTKWTWEDVHKRGFTQHAADTGETLNGWYGRDILRGGAGNDVLDGGQGSNELYGGDGDDVLRVSEYAKDNLFVGGKGNDTMYGSKYADTYVFNLGDGHDTIVETDSYSNVVDVLKFGEDLSPEQLWFQRRDNHLDILVAGTEDRVTVNDWYSGSRHRIEIMQASNGLALTESRVQNLVNAMAAFAVPAGADFNLLPDQRAQLDMVIAANWQ